MRRCCSYRSVRNANQVALARIVSSEPLLFDVRRAIDAIPGMTSETLLHAGPPLPEGKMCGAMRGAVIGAVLFERWAGSVVEANRLIDSKRVRFSPTHHHQAVAPMAGIISPSMQVLCVRNATYGNVSYSNLNEGLGHVLRFGAFDKSVLRHLRWLNGEVGPVLREAIRLSGPVPLKPIMKRALQKGDECHNRHVAGNGLFIDYLRPYLIKMGLKKKRVNRVLEFIEKNYYSFLNISLAACKCMADSAQHIPYSTVVYALSRNGNETGVRVSGLNGHWFRDRSPTPNGRFFKGYKPEDANPDMGDSTITETVGIGAFAMAAAPKIVSYLGGEADDVIRYSEMMYNITFGENGDFRIGQFGGRGSPLGIDILKVCETGITPIINTGIAHKNGGVGQIGAGYVRAPMGCFQAALGAFEEQYGKI